MTEYGHLETKTRATVETIDGPGIPLYHITLTVPDVGTFTYRPLKESTKASEIARAAVGADPYHLSMILCSKGWTKT